MFSQSTTEAIKANEKAQKNKQKINEKVNEILFTLAVVLTITIVAQLTVNYLYLNDIAITASTKQETLAGLKTENNRLQNLQQNYSKLIVDSAKIENDYRLLQPLIPQKAELPKILDWLSEQSYLRNLKLEGFEKNVLKQTAGQKIGQLEQVSITATVSGDLSQINKFISDFARHERLLLVESVRIAEKEKNTDSTEVNKYKAQVIFTTFLGLDNGKLKPKV